MESSLIPNFPRWTFKIALPFIISVTCYTLTGPRYKKVEIITFSRIFKFPLPKKGWNSSYQRKHKKYTSASITIPLWILLWAILSFLLMFEFQMIWFPSNELIFIHCTKLAPVLEISMPIMWFNTLLYYKHGKQTFWFYWRNWVVTKAQMGKNRTGRPFWMVAGEKKCWRI